MQNLYTGRMNKIVVMNIGFLSRMLYGMVKPILPERTRRKMFFIGSNMIQGIPNEFDASALPVAFGGTNPKTIEQLCSEFEY